MSLVRNLEVNAIQRINCGMAPRSKWDVLSLYCVLAAEELSPNFMDNFFQSRCSRKNRSIEEAQGESFDILGLDLRYISIPCHSATPGSVLCRNRLCGSQIHWAYKYGRKSNQKGQSRGRCVSHLTTATVRCTLILLPPSRTHDACKPLSS